MDVAPRHRRNAVQRAVARFAASGPGSWLLADVLHRVDRPVHRLTGGRHTVTSLLSGLPVAMVTTTGARTGQPRSVPLIVVPIEDRLALVASNYGQPHHPSWSHNLLANPDGTIVVEGRTWPFRARQVTGAERARVWERCTRLYPGYETYVRRAAPRVIRVFLLDPT